ALLQDLLHRIGLVEVPRLDLGRQRRQVGPRACEGVEVIGDALDARAIGHGHPPGISAIMATGGSRDKHLLPPPWHAKQVGAGMTERKLACATIGSLPFPATASARR